VIKTVDGPIYKDRDQQPYKDKQTKNKEVFSVMCRKKKSFAIRGKKNTRKENRGRMMRDLTLCLQILANASHI
jgi:hypothetical protein